MLALTSPLKENLLLLTRDWYGCYSYYSCSAYTFTLSPLRARSYKEDRDTSQGAASSRTSTLALQPL